MTTRAVEGKQKSCCKGVDAGQVTDSTKLLKATRYGDVLKELIPTPGLALSDH